MDRALALSLGLASIGLVALAVYAHVNAPRAVPLGDLARREGQRVCVEADLAHVRTTASGSARVVLSDGFSSVGLWARFTPTAVPGDRVQACGIVGRTGTGPELALERPEDLRVVRSWDADAVSVDALARTPWQWRDRHVVVHTDVRCERGACWAHDPTSPARLPLAGRPQEGVQRLEGVVVYDEERAAFRLDVEP